MEKEKPIIQGQGEVVQRYCPKKGENVVMLRIYGIHYRFRCYGYESCPFRDEKFCKGETQENRY